MPKRPKDSHISVTTVESVDDAWSIEFADGVILNCAKAPPRNESHVDALINSHGHSGIDPVHFERMQAMIAAVREKEAQQ
jgi:hypothetical protein